MKVTNKDSAYTAQIIMAKDQDLIFVTTKVIFMNERESAKGIHYFIRLDDLVLFKAVHNEDLCRDVRLFIKTHIAG